jgi:choline dehydrogenase-like flavoprotein
MSGDWAYAALAMRGLSPEKIFEHVHNGDELAGFGAMCIDTSNDSNVLTLTPDGKVEINYHLSADDKVRLRKGIADGVRMMFLAGAAEVILPTVDPNFRNALTKIEQADEVEKSLDLDTLESTLTSAHMQGTLRIGDKPENSVVDIHHRFWGMTNFYAAGTAVFPGSIGANPMQAAYTDGKLLADSLNQSLKPVLVK